MEIIEKKLAQLNKAVTTLARVIDLEHHNPDPDNIHRDAKIQRFEYTSKLFWKFLKIYLEKIHGIKATTPKNVYREAFTAELLSQEEAKQCIKMVDTRNITSHIYNEKKAETIARQIDSYFPLMQTITLRLSIMLQK